MSINQGQPIANLMSDPTFQSLVRGLKIAATHTTIYTEAAPSAIHPVDIDPDGDLLIDATANPRNRYRFRVCSEALRRQSPVWKQMLFGPWKEAKPADGTSWVVEFPDDPAYSLHIILSIIHGKFDCVPQTPDLRTIHKFLVLAHKYDITGVVRPWAFQWLKVASGFNLLPVDVVRSLYIAWELGDEHLFAMRLEEISLKAKINSDGYLVYGEKIVLEAEDYLGPQAALDSILEIRMVLLEKLIVPIHEALDARMKEEPFCTPGDYVYYDRSRGRDCDATIIGGIYRGMTQTIGGIPSRSAPDTKGSVVELASSLFSTMTKVSSAHRVSFGHQPDCQPQSKFQDLNETIHNSIPTVVARFVKQEYKDYLAKQRKKTGLVLADTPTRNTSRYW